MGGKKTCGTWLRMVASGEAQGLSRVVSLGLLRHDGSYFSSTRLQPTTTTLP